MNPRTAGSRLRRHPVRTAVVVALLLPVLFCGANLVVLATDRREMGGWKSAAAERRFLKAYDEVMALMPPPAETHDYRTDFGTVRAYKFEKAGADEVYRSRTPLLLLPGHSAPVPMWLSDMPILVADRPVWAIDLLGQPGKSVTARQVADKDDQARWLHQVITQTKAPKVHLVGLSFGGWTAINYTLHHPQHVASVSLADPAAVFAPFKPSMMAAAALTTFPLMPRVYNDWFVEWTTGEPVDRSIPEFKIVSAGVDEYVVREPTPELPSDDQLRSLRVPVMALIGGRSVVHDANSAASRARALLPDGEITVDPAKGHAVNGPDFNRRVLAFVARHA